MTSRHHGVVFARRPALLAVAALVAALAAPARAEPAEIRIPAQGLSSALDALAQQAGIRLLYSPEAVAGRKAPPLQGRMSPDQALDRLLAGSGLSWSSADGAYAVRATDAREMEPVVVTATRTEQRVTDVPASVSVITAKDIESRPARKVEDLLRDLEGVDVKAEAAGGAGMVMMRGLGGSYAGQTTQILVDGMALEPTVLAPRGAGLDLVGLGEVERVEVVRGPASALYGPSAMGGVVNVITRRWSGAPGGEIEVGGGSHDAYSLRAGVGAALDKVDFRLYASEFGTRGFVAEREAYFWGQRDLAGRGWQDRKRGFQVGVQTAEDQEVTLAVRNYQTESAFIGGRPNYRWDREGTWYDLGYRIGLGDAGQIKLRYLNGSIRENLGWDGLALGDPGDFTRYSTGWRSEDVESLEAQANVRVNATHLLTLGLSRSQGRQAESENWSVPADSRQGWDYYSRSEIRSRTTVDSLYAQDEARLSERLTLLLGGRYDRYKLHGNSDYAWDNYGTDATRRDPDSSDGVFNPRLGLRYRLAAATSLYASYGTAYLPALNGLRYRSNSACDSPDLQPERARSYEFGVDHDWSGMKTRAALFHTDYEDKIEARQTPACTQYLNVGKVAVDGLELALEGSAAVAWRPYANYSYTDSRITANAANPASEGKRLNLVARHKFNLGMLYAPTRQFSARLSGRYVGDRYFDAGMSNREGARAPAYFLADFKIAYRFALEGVARDAELSLAINNLFDRSYVEQKWFADVAGGVEAYRAYGDGRNWWLGLRTRF